MPSESCFETLSQGLLAIQERAVKYIDRILVEYDDRPRRVGGTGESALAYEGARARGVKRGEAAVLIRKKP